jgi:hypothetical protein
MNHGKLNIDLPFPIIVFNGNDIDVIQETEHYLMCKKSRIPILAKFKETIMDCYGNEYIRTDIKPLKHINMFYGFSLPFGGFGVCYLEIKIEKIKALSNDELKERGRKIINSKRKLYSGTTLNFKKWEKEFYDLADKEDILRYLFYFAKYEYYVAPDNGDQRWRARRYLKP